MCRFLLVGLAMCAVAFFAFVTSAPAGERPTPPYRDVLEHSLVRVGWPGGEGSGFYLGEGRFMTAGHVVTAIDRASNGPTPWVKFWAGQSVPIKSAWHTENELDIGILEVDPAKVPAFAKPVDLACAYRPFAGETIYALGSPLDLNWAVSRGVVASTRGLLELYGRVGLDVTVAPGSSGGPIIVPDGRVIGVTTAILRMPPLGPNKPDGPSGFSIMMGPASLCKALDAYGEGTETVPAIPSPF